MKKIFNKVKIFILAIISFCTLISMVNATNEYKIEIAGSSSTHKYGAWQIFKGSVGPDGSLSNIEWGSGIDNTSTLINDLKQDSILNTYFTDVTDAYDVAKALSEIGSGDDSKEAKQFAEIVSKYLKSNTSNESTFSNNKHTISNLDAGYYFIKDVSQEGIGEASTRYILKVTNDTSINVKADAPTASKQVSNKGANNYHDAISAEIGSIVTFKITGTLPSTYADYKTYYYHFIDTLPKGLKYQESTLKVTIGGQDATSYFTINNGNTLDITINDLVSLNASLSINDKTEIVVTYDARVEKDAVIGSQGNTNIVQLEYSSNPNNAGSSEHQKTVQDTATVYAYQLEIIKVNSKNNNPLSGVKFKLYKYIGEEKKYAQISNGIISWGDIDTATELITEDGKITINGLMADTYYLTETYSLPGYDSIDDVKVVIEEKLSEDNVLVQELKQLTISVDNGEKTNGDTTSGKVSLTIQNVPGILLPSTGGIGVIIIYAIGICLLILSIALLLRKKYEQK